MFRKALVPVAVLLLVSSCRKDEPVKPLSSTGGSATLRVRIVPNWDGAPFQRYTEYRDWQNLRVKVEMLRFYMSDLRLVNGDGEHTVQQVALVDMDNGTMQFDLKVPAGQWWGMRAGLGLPAALNASDPALYANEHPLSVNNGMYWSWASGYKFMLLDGRFDPDPLSTGMLMGLMAIHTGNDTCFSELGFFPPVPFRTTLDSMSNFTIHVAVDRFFYSPEEALDVRTENQSNGSNVPLAMKFTRNIVRSMSAEVQ